MTARTARRALGALALCGVLGALHSAPVRAGDLLRCEGPDGKTVYTDDKSVCPDAEPFEPSGRVTNAETPARPAARAPARPSAAVEEAEAARWRAKKADKQAELAVLAERRQELKRFVAICNRRGRVFRYDEAGIEREVPCKDLQRRFAALDAEEAEVRAYLDKGLAEECRRAGCLPGWIR